MSKIRKALENENVSKEKIKEVLNILGIKESERWKPSLYEGYWLIRSGFVDSSMWNDSTIDGNLWLLGGVFRTKEEAVNNLEKRYFLEKMKNDFEDSSDEIDWTDDSQKKYSVRFDHLKNKIEVTWWSQNQLQGTLHTTNKEWLAQYIIDNEQQIKKHCFGIEL